MNTNMIINISIIVGAIAITIINENLKKQNQQRMYDSIKNKLNSVEPQNNHSQNNKLYVLSSK